MARKPSGVLRRGWTTGACATAAAKAAYTALLSGHFPDPVTLTLPGGQTPSFSLARERLGEGEAMAAIVKDAGDDPDVTHTAQVVVTVRRGQPGTGITFRAGDGVGTVTRAGLELEIGEPAINPAPRRMMKAVVIALAEAHGDTGDVEIEVSIPGGAALAQRTMNARLGIVGGLSILGTTGIVVPFSCASWIAAIHSGIDVARAADVAHVAAATGSVSEQAVQRLYALPDHALIDMGDFAGGLLKYLRRHPIAKLTIAGGFAKIAKLAAGHLDLHSGRSQVDYDWLAALLGALGADQATVVRAREANTARHVLEMARQGGWPLGARVAELARETALGVLNGGISVEVVIFDRQGQMVGRSDD